MSLFKKSITRHAAWMGILVIGVMAVLLIAGCSVPASSAVSTAQPYTSAAAPATQVSSLFDENAITGLYSKSIPAVVQIEHVIKSTLTQVPSPFNFNIPAQVGQGSGFLIDGQGHILTNYHVVDGATTVTIILNDGTEMDGTVLGTDNSNDIALIQVDPAKVSQISYLPLGDSSKVKPGQMAIALGSPSGLQGSITVGIISGIGRTIPSTTERTITNIIQTDAAINPGNSGGPLLNSSGEAIGINTAIEASATSIGFVIPINTVKSRLPDLIKGGAVKTAWLGASITTVNKDLATRLNLAVDKGVYVIQVLPSSPAEKAGLIAAGTDTDGAKAGGDIIVAIDNTPLFKNADLLTYLGEKHPGDTINLSIQRGAQKISVPVELGEWPDKLSAVTPEPTIPDDGHGFDFGPFHFRIK